MVKHRLIDNYKTANMGSGNKFRTNHKNFNKMTPKTINEDA